MCMRVQGKDLAPADDSGTSDPFIEFSVLDTALACCRPSHAHCVGYDYLSQKRVSEPISNAGLVDV